jgi:protein-disulfide isomerase
MISRPIRVAIAVAAMCAAAAAQAQGITSEQAKEILNELKQIRQLIEGQAQGAAPAPALPVSDKVSMALPQAGFSMGRADAPLTMVEFTDLQCPFCQSFHNTVFEDLKKNYIDSGKVRFISRDYPLPFHENAMRAAEAARCGGEQGKFWELRHVMLVNADKLQHDKILDYAKTLKLEAKAFEACLGSGKYRQSIADDIALGNAAGVSGTPTFIVGRVQNGQLDGLRIVGAQPYSEFEAKLQELLAGAPAK